MRAFFSLLIWAHRLSNDRTGRVATGYVHMAVYVAIAALVGMVLLGDSFEGMLSDIRRTIFGSAYG